MSYALVLRLVRPFLHRAERELLYLIAFAESRYTWLLVLVLFIVGSALIFAAAYLNRYAYWNYWFWKSRAIAKISCYGAMLVTLKILLGVLR